MSNRLKNRKVAILMTDGFEEVEYTEPRKALEEEGAEITVISLKKGEIRAWDKDKWGNIYEADREIGEVGSEEFDALMLPGGVMNPDNLRQNAEAVSFVTDFICDMKPIAAICHAPQILIETAMINGRKMTSYPSIKTDLINAGVKWVDTEVQVDRGLVTSRRPDDIPAFNKKMIEEFLEGRHASTESA